MAMIAGHGKQNHQKQQLEFSFKRFFSFEKKTRYKLNINKTLNNPHPRPLFYERFYRYRYKVTNDKESINCKHEEDRVTPHP